MVIFLLGLCALAGPEAHLEEVRWAPVDAWEHDRGTLEDGTRGRILPSGGALRVRCEDGARPSREALFDSDGEIAWLSQPAPRQDDGGWWRFEAPEGAPDAWLLRPADCQVERLSDRATSRGFARLERLAGDLPGLRQDVDGGAVFTPLETAWLGRAVDDEQWWSRYRALRPAGPEPRAQGLRAPDGGARVDAPDGRWWSGSLDWRLRGPARVRVDARAVGDQERLCLTVDGQPWCQGSRPARQLQVRDGAVVSVPLTLDGAPLGVRRAWLLALPPGAHTLSLDGLALLRTALPGDYLGERLQPQLAVYPDPPEQIPAPPRWTLTPVREVPGLLLRRPSVSTEPQDPTWIPMGALSRVDAEWIGAGGQASVWLSPRGADPCGITGRDGRTWWARVEKRLQRLAWTGQADPAPPVVSGCDAWVRVSGLHSPVEGRQVVSLHQRPRPGEAVRYSTRPDVQTYLWISHEAGDAQPSTLTVRLDAEPERTVRLVPDPDAPPAAEGVDGSRWSAPLRIALGVGHRQVEVRADAPLALRLSQRADPLPSASTQETSASQQDQPLVERVRELSRALSQASDSGERARLLLRRGALLSQAAQPDLAYTDFARAEALSPGLLDHNPAREQAALTHARLLVGMDAWVPLDPAWVPAVAGWSPADIAALVDAAAAGDFVGVAAALQSDGADARPWWRRAITGGQVLTSRQRMASYAALLGHTDTAERDHPWLWPLRATTRWEAVHQVHGVARVAHEVWPDEHPATGAEWVDALFPDAWPATHVLTLRRGWELELAPSRKPQDLAVRCRASGVVPPKGDCRFSVVDRDRAVRARVRAPTSGVQAVLHVPAHSGRLYLRARPGGGVLAQVQLPQAPTRRRDHRVRRALVVNPGDTVSFEVFGPTVVRLDTWSAGEQTLRIRLNDQAPVERELDSVEDALVSVPMAGPVTVQLTPSRRLRVVPYLRVPDRRSTPPLPDLARIAMSLQAPVPPLPPVTPGSGDEQGALSQGRPVQRPALTGLVGLGVGTADDPDAQSPGALRPQTWAVTGTAGLAQRLEAPVWGEWGVGAQVAGGRPTLAWTGLGTDARLWARRWRWWSMGDLDVVQGVVGGSSLVTGHGLLRVQAERALSPRWELRLANDAVIRGILAGGSPDRADLAGVDRLWSRYKWDHPAQLAPQLEARWTASGLLRAWGRARVSSNTQLSPYPVDHWTLGAGLDLGAPARWLRVGISLDRRLADLHRADPWWGPAVQARGGVALWPRAGDGLLLDAGLGYDVHLRRLSAGVRLRLALSRDRALRDLRPSSGVLRHAESWEQDQSADVRYRPEASP